MVYYNQVKGETPIRKGIHPMFTVICADATYTLNAFDFLSELEDTLYIEQELIPVSRNWESELLRNHQTQFTYHYTEFVTVKWIGNGTFTVSDDE